MKKILLSLLAIAAVFVSCKKEASVESESSKTITIAASFDEATKATFSAVGVFSWESDDEIAYILRHDDDDHYDGNALKTTDSGSNATFTGSTSATNFTPINLAFYPKNRNQGDVNYNTLAVNNTSSVKTLQATLAGTITARPDRLSRIIPMIGKKTGEDASGYVEHYHFYPVTGVLKVSFTGLPSTASQIRLTVPDAATYPLNGTFNIDTERAIPEIKATDVATGYDLKYLNFDYASSDDAFYFPIPTGTIPAGKLTVSVTDGTNILYAVTNKQDIVLTRGEITELPSISVKLPAITISGTSSAPTLAYNKDGLSSVVKFCACISNSASNNFANYPTGLYFSTASGSYNIASWDGDGKLTASGKYYLHWVALSENINANTLTSLSDTRIKAYGVIPFYFITDADKTAILGNWTHNTSDGCQHTGSPGDVPATANFTFVEGTNAINGNLRVSNFDGLTCTYVINAVFDSSSRTIELFNYNYFDASHYFARISGESTHLNLVFTNAELTSFYADYSFGLKTSNNWTYYYNTSSSHLYTKPE